LGKREAFGPLENNEQQFEIYNSEDLFTKLKDMPVLHLDLSGIDVFDPVTGIADELRNNFEENKFDVPDDIEEEFRRKRSVVRMINLTVRYFARHSPSGQIIILIDEYDSPITKAIAENLTDQANISLAKKNRDVLRAFFSPLKALGSMIHLLFMTGVTKFSYTNLFSSMNDLDDMSTDTSLHALTGYTLDEVRNTYPNAYEELERKYGANLDERIINEYNGYKFCTDATEGLLNPWDLNQLLKKHQFENYWAARGRSMHLWTLFDPTVHSILEIIEPQGVVNKFTQPVDLSELIKPSTQTMQKLFYETGYLTIKDNKLTVPNNSVRETLISDLSARLELDDNNDITIKMKEALIEENMKKLFEQLGRLIKSFPHPMFRTIQGEKHVGKIEAVYAAALYVSMLHLKRYFPHLTFLAEGSTLDGTLDLFIKLKRSMHIIEYKVVQDKSKKGLSAFKNQALAQMKQKNYANHHLILQSRSDLKLHLTVFVFDIEDSRFGIAETIVADDSISEVHIEECSLEE